MSANFIRKTEDFVCEHCGRQVKGNGYTNHCPYCLYSKHVDNTPGDRAANCGGLMRPVHIELKNNERVITHECLSCGYRKPNKSASDDNFDVILQIIREENEELL